MRDRKPWDEYFMDIALMVATRSTCIRRHVGAVLVLDKRIIATGYNGAPEGIEHCTTETCIRNVMAIPSGERHELCMAVHAEQNCIMSVGGRLDGATLYCTTAPCNICAKLIVQAGIKRVVFMEGYSDELSHALFSKAGTEVVKLS